MFFPPLASPSSKSAAPNPLRLNTPTKDDGHGHSHNYHNSSPKVPNQSLSPNSAAISSPRTPTLGFSGQQGNPTLTPAQVQRNRKTQQSFWRQTRASCGACTSFDGFCALSGPVFLEAKAVFGDEDQLQLNIASCIELITTVVRQRFEDVTR